MRSDRRDRDFSSNRGVFRPRFAGCATHFPFQDAPRPLISEQVPARHEQIRQRKGNNQPIGVLRDAAVAYLRELEHALDHADCMLNASAYPRARTVDPALLFAQVLVAPSTFLRQISCRRRLGLNLLGLPRIGAIAPQTRGSPPCSRAGMRWLSCTLAGVAATEWIIFVLLSTSTRAFMPKYHRGRSNRLNAARRQAV